MAQKKAAQVKRVFSVELNSRGDLRNVNLPSESEHLMMEGTIGALERAEFIEDSVLELVGTHGVLRVDLSPQDLQKQCPKAQGAGDKK